MRITVTGASGHIGGNLVRALLDDGRPDLQVRALIHHNDRALADLPRDRLEVLRGDLLDPGFAGHALDGSEVVYHLAARISLDARDAPAMERINVEGTKRILAACRERGVRRLVYFSSVHAFSTHPGDRECDETRPLSDGDADAPAYDRTKARALRAMHEAVAAGLDAVAVHPTGVIGPHDYRPSEMGTVIRNLCTGRMPALVTGGFNFVDVRDVVAGALGAEARGRTGESYLLGGEWRSRWPASRRCWRRRAGSSARASARRCGWPVWAPRSWWASAGSSGGARCSPPPRCTRCGRTAWSRTRRRRASWATRLAPSRRASPRRRSGCAGQACWVDGVRRMELLRSLEARLLEPFIYGWAALAAVVCVVLFFVVAPYGRHAREGWGPKIPSTLGWIVMEAPSPILMALFFFLGERRDPASIAFLVMWELHYANRAFIYPLRRRGGAKPMPAVIVLQAVFFNCVNGWTCGRWLFTYGPPHPPEWLSDPRFLVGAALFVVGLTANLHSDQVLMTLRAPGETGYRIPRGGLYRWVSAPNYLAEIVEWWGFALATWSLAPLGFAVWTTANLLPRARSNHDWYRRQFADYPAERRALIPGVF